MNNKICENNIDIEEEGRATIADIIEYLKTLDQRGYLFIEDSEYPGDYLYKNSLNRTIVKDEDKDNTYSLY